MSNTKALFQRKADLTKQMRAQLDKARAEDRGLNDEERKTYEANVATLASLEEDLKRETALLEIERNIASVGDSNQAAAVAAGAANPACRRRAAVAFPSRPAPIAARRPPTGRSSPARARTLPRADVRRAALVRRS